jgi:hypothetical protein
MYEGNLDRRWGNLSGEELTRRFWLGVMSGCYVTHGETYLDPDHPADEKSTATMLWSNGGAIKGTSPARIAFLRRLVEETVIGAGSKTGLEAGATQYYPNAFSVDDGGKLQQQILYYLDYHQPIQYEFQLPEGTFAAELIDPWLMTVTAVPGKFQGKTKLKLTGKPYQAVRFKRVAG